MELIDEPLTDSELHSLIRMADADNNGKIDYEGKGKKTWERPALSCSVFVTDHIGNKTCSKLVHFDKYVYALNMKQ